MRREEIIERLRNASRVGQTSKEVLEGILKVMERSDARIFTEQYGDDAGKELQSGRLEWNRVKVRKALKDAVDKL